MPPKTHLEPKIPLFTLISSASVHPFSSFKSPPAMENPSRKMAMADRFESLPHELLTHIVSFLPFKEAVRASCLGHRWEYCWLQHRRIDLDETPFIQNEERRLLIADGQHSLSSRLYFTGRRQFISFASSFIAQYTEPKVESFRLCFSHPQQYSEKVKEWVRFAVVHGVETIELIFFDHRFASFYLPEEVYGMCLSLRVMALTGCNIQAGRFGNLHALRSLTLSTIHITWDSFKLLMANCPLLEELYLMHLSMDAIIIGRDCRYLRVLHVEFCFAHYHGLRIFLPPALQHLKCRGSVPLFSFRELISLKEAELDFRKIYTLSPFECLSFLLIDLANTEKLTICNHILQAIPFGGHHSQLPAQLDKLKHLTLIGTTLHKSELPGIAILMRSYPQLEFLTVIMDNAEGHISGYSCPFLESPEGASFWDKQLAMPISCLKESLKYVEVKGFTGHRNQVEFTEFILGAAEALHELNICTSQEATTLDETKEQCMIGIRNLLHCARASANVKITIG